MTGILGPIAEAGERKDARRCFEALIEEGNVGD